MQFSVSFTNAAIARKNKQNTKKPHQNHKQTKTEKQEETQKILHCTPNEQKKYITVSLGWHEKN